MEINEEIIRTLEDIQVDKDEGLLYLLSLYFGLKVPITDLNTVNTINLSRIVEKDYKENVLIWNTPLFKMEVPVHEFDWVPQWAEAFTKINPTRRASAKDLITRMKRFFAEYPQYRKDDVFKARDAYFKSLDSPTYIKNPLKFIAEGQGSYKTSSLLGWCEVVTKENQKTDNIKGLLK